MPNLGEGVQGNSGAVRRKAKASDLNNRTGHAVSGSARAPSIFMDMDSVSPSSAARSSRTRNIDELVSDGGPSRPSKRQKTDQTSPHETATKLLGLAEQSLQDAQLKPSASVVSNDHPSVIRSNPMELAVLYDHHNIPSAVLDTIVDELRAADSEQAVPACLFRATGNVLSEIGAHGVDAFWSCAQSDLQGDYSSADAFRIVPNTPSDRTRTQLSVNHVIERWRALRTGDCRRFLASPKFVKLNDLLEACEPYGDSFRGVIIARSRVIARTLTELLSSLDHIRCTSVCSTGSGNSEHQATLNAFATGTYNLLIVTTSAEDLDIPKASIVIRFDLIDCQISYAYAHARCLGRESHLVHMVERNNSTHRRILSRLTNMDNDMRWWTEKVASDPSSAIPPKTLCNASNLYLLDIDGDVDDYDEICITDPITCSKISKLNATAVFYRYLARSQREGLTIQDRTRLFDFSVERQPGDKSQFKCTILLPEESPIHNVSSLPCLSMAEARRTACFEACNHLFQQGVLNYLLFPKPSPLRLDQGAPSGANNTAVSTAGAHRHLRKSPDFWCNALSSTQDVLYPIVVSPGNMHGETHASVLILTRLPLPELADFSVFSSGFSTTVRLHQGAPFNANRDQLGMLHGYTVRVYQAVMNKALSCPLDSMAYFFAPLSHTWFEPNEKPIQRWRLPAVDIHIPWDLVRLATDNFTAPLLLDETAMVDQSIKDAIIQDRSVEFTNRFFVVCVRHDLTPLSKADDSVREAGYANFVEHCKARRKGFEGLKNYDQPMIEVSLVPSVVNNLNPTSAPSIPASKTPAKYLIPELCTKFTIPAGTFRTVLLLPAITRRIDDMLLVKELNAHFFAHSILERHLLAALTPPSACVQYDYERLELLGDTFLKYVSSLHCFVTMPAQASGSLHRVRQEIISNKALLEGATRAGLPPYIQSKPFAVKLWKPVLAVDASNSMTAPSAQTASQPGEPGKRLKRNKQKDDQNIQWLGDKTVADVVEAIIGAAFLTGGQNLALSVTKTLKVAVPGVEHWSDFARIATPSDNDNRLQIQTVTAVESLVGRQFTRRYLLAQALTHASVKGPNVCSYDRLEFLGDAILDYLVVRNIFQQHPHLSPGGLTLLKSAMVSNHALAALCVHIGLHKHVQHVSSDLAASIRIYAEGIKARRKQEHKLAEQEKRQPCQYWLDIEPPKVLSDVVESIIGALYVSDDYSDAGAQTFFDNVLKSFYDQHIRLQTLSLHPNATLFNWLQAEGCQQHRLSKEVGQTIRYDMLVHDVILASASDINTAVAMRRASMCALDALEGDPDFLTRTCDCRAMNRGKKSKKDQSQAQLGYTVEE
ncbi:hypothetical protein B0H21DRAFT_345297 [Amylocystis lapponica]|nr:hypothetical protein B0H21DRAFT_345297 [Amylocystis lapponica]